mgnify:CR=1 FL=1
MTCKQKVKGNRVEREVVQLAQSKGFTSQRAYASNGRSLGMAEEVDVLIGEYRVQVKARKSFPKWLLEASKNVDWVVFKENGQPFKVMLELDTLLSYVEKPDEKLN